MSKEAEGAELEWVNLSFKVKCEKQKFFQKTEYKQVLQPFSASIPPRSLVAVMGSSGAGKTTFLNTLTYQFEGGIRDGDVLLNGKSLTPSYFRKTCGYVRQNDVLLPHLTVFETLEFYANITLPHVSSKERYERIISTTKKLGISHCLDSAIGNDLKRGISGGEKRRVSIAVELLKNPIVLFLDEPTSGLDSKTALSLMTTLAELAHLYNHTVVCTIHQPRSQIFNQFDKLILLAKGAPIFVGDRTKAIDYFASKGFECPHFENPSDFFIDILTIDSDTPESFEESTNRIQRLIEESSIDRKEEMDNFSIRSSKKKKKSRTEAIISNILHVPVNLWVTISAIFYLYKRANLNSFRNIDYLISRLAEGAFTIIAISLLWWQMDTDQSSIFDRTSYILLVLLTNAMNEGYYATFVFPEDRLIFLREKKSGMYSVFSYYIAKQLAEFPLQLLVPSLFALITYMCVGMQYDAVNFGNFYLLVILISFAANSVGMVFGAIFPITSATVFYSLWIIMDLMFSGFYVNSDNIPSFVRWVKYISISFYGLSGALIGEYT